MNFRRQDLLRTYTSTVNYENMAQIHKDANFLAGKNTETKVLDRHRYRVPKRGNHSSVKTN